MKVRMSCFLVVLAVSATLSGSLRAGIIAQTGFNDETGINSDAVVDGVPYLDGESMDTAGQGAGEPGWTTGWSRPSSTGPAVTDSVNPFEGDLALHSTLDASNHSVWKRGFTPQTSGVVKLSARVYIDVFGSNAFTFYLDNQTDTEFGVVVSFDDDGSVDVIGGNGHNATSVTADVMAPGTIVEDTWNLFEAEANMATQMFSLTINGTSLGDYFFRTTGVLDSDPILDLGTFRFQNSIGQVSFVDDVVIELVPEPTSLLLVGLASLGLCAFRRRSEC